MDHFDLTSGKSWLSSCPLLFIFYAKENDHYFLPPSLNNYISGYLLICIECSAIRVGPHGLGLHAIDSRQMHNGRHDTIKCPTSGQSGVTEPPLRLRTPITCQTKQYCRNNHQASRTIVPPPPRQTRANYDAENTAPPLPTHYLLPVLTTCQTTIQTSFNLETSFGKRTKKYGNNIQV